MTELQRVNSNSNAHTYANTLMHTSHSAFVKFAKKCYFKENQMINEIFPLVQPKMKIDTTELNHKFITISIRTTTLQLSNKKGKKKCTKWSFEPLQCSIRTWNRHKPYNALWRTWQLFVNSFSQITLYKQHKA